MKRIACLTAMVGAVFALGVACDNPFRDDGGEGYPTEDEQAIMTYTQTVNQSSASSDTTVAPVVNGNNNQITIVFGDGNAPSTENSHDELQSEEEAPSEPTP